MGHSFFRLKSKEVTIITDPFDSKLGFKMPGQVTANIVTISHQHPGHNYYQCVEGSPRVIKGPGEYEINNIYIIGLRTFHDETAGQNSGKNVVYLIEMDGINICHLGDLGHKPTAQQMEELSNIDVLLLPVGGISTINAAAAAELVRLLSPKIVVPMHYRTTATPWLDPLDMFLQNMGQKDLTPQPKLVVTKSNIPQETRLVLLDYPL